MAALHSEWDTQFSHWKSRHKCRLALRRVNFISALGINFRIARSRTIWRCNFKGLSQDGGWANFSIFLKTSAPHSLMTTYRINLLSDRSISLDSTFKTRPLPFSLLGAHVKMFVFSAPPSLLGFPLYKLNTIIQIQIVCLLAFKWNSRVKLREDLQIFPFFDSMHVS